MTKHGPKIEVETPEREFASNVVVVNGRLVRPGDVLVNLNANKEAVAILERLGARRYDPREFSPEEDWRQREGAPDYGDINGRLAEHETGIELWSGLKRRPQLELMEEKKVVGLHYNHVFVGEDFYHGGPGGAPTAIPGPTPAQLSKWTGNSTADIAVLDNGLPTGWQTLHPELKPVVDRQGLASLPNDPLDEGPDGHPDGVLDKQAGHGLFICGLIARVAPELDIRLNRVLHASGEGEEALIKTTLLELLDSPVKVISMSLGAVPATGPEPLLAGTIRSLVAAGKVVVASAGNAGCTVYGPHALFPANMPEVIAVGAYDSTNGTPRRWPHSCFGDVYAPGHDLVSSYVEWPGPIDWPGATGNQGFYGWARWSGTSFAAPLVAAHIARLLTGTHTAGSASAAAQTWLASLDPSEWTNKTQTGKAPLYEPTHNLTGWA